MISILKLAFRIPRFISQLFFLNRTVPSTGYLPYLYRLLLNRCGTVPVTLWSNIILKRSLVLSATYAAYLKHKAMNKMNKKVPTLTHTVPYFTHNSINSQMKKNIKSGACCEDRQVRWRWFLKSKSLCMVDEAWSKTVLLKQFLVLKFVKKLKVVLERDCWCKISISWWQYGTRVRPGRFDEVTPYGIKILWWVPVIKQ
jgi:hypothetical protein